MSKPLDRLTLLETFARIAERGSISAAARDLGLSQASASRQLQALEDRLGADLIRRTTHSLSLTAAGEALLTDARGLLAGWDALEEVHGAADGNLSGRLKVVAPVALGQLHLADIAVRFQLAHPAVSIDWLLDDAPIRFAEIGCDCWIKVGRVPDETLIVRELGRVERLIVAAPALIEGKSVSTPDNLAALPCAALDPFEGGRIALTSSTGETHMLGPTVALSTNNIFALHRVALLGAGFAVLPRWFVVDDLAAGRLADLLPDWRAATLSVHVAYLPSRRRPRRLSLFLEALEEGFAAIPGISALED